MPLFGAFAGFGRLHLEGVVEAVEVVEETDGGHELDDLALVVEIAEPVDEFVGDVIGVEGHLLGERERGLLGMREVVAELIVGEIVELVFRYPSL